MVVGPDNLGIDPISISNIFDDGVFCVAKRFDIGSLATVDIVINPIACDCERLIFLPVNIKAAFAGPINIDLYFGTESDEDGTLWETTNRDNTSSVPSLLTFRLSPTINNPGTKLPTEFVIFSDGIPASVVLGGESKDGFPFRARQDGKYMFRLTNLEANTSKAHATFSWFELPKN